MKILRDIRSPWLIHLKGALFLLLGAVAAALLIAQVPTLKTVALLAVTVWAFCRFYYYLFYVLERYLGLGKPVASITVAIRSLRSRPIGSPKPKP